MLSFLVIAFLSLSPLSSGNVIPSAGTVVPVPSNPKDTSPIPSCNAASTNDTFEISQVSYELYLNKPGGIDTPPDQITMAFEVTNNASNVQTACSFTNSLYRSSSGPKWADYGTRWYPCGDRTVGNDSGSSYVVKTNAQFAWGKFQLKVNQTWMCADGTKQKQTVFNGVATTTLSPVCHDTNNTAWFARECSAPDTTAPVVLSL